MNEENIGETGKAGLVELHENAMDKLINDLEKKIQDICVAELKKVTNLNYPLFSDNLYIFFTVSQKIVIGQFNDFSESIEMGDDVEVDGEDAVCIASLPGAKYDEITTNEFIDGYFEGDNAGVCDWLKRDESGDLFLTYSNECNISEDGRMEYTVEEFNPNTHKEYFEEYEAFEDAEDGHEGSTENSLGDVVKCGVRCRCDFEGIAENYIDYISFRKWEKSVSEVVNEFTEASGMVIS